MHHPSRQLSSYYLVRIGIIVILALSAPVGQAAVIQVTNSNPVGAGSLSEAITTANSNGQADTIQIVQSPVFALTLTGNLPRITESNTTIDATGTFALIDGNSSVYNAFHLDGVTGCTIRNFSIAGANYGVLMSNGSSNLVDACKIEGNTRPVFFDGTSSSSVTGSLILGNTNGITLQNAANNTIGGTTTSAGNRIAGNATNAGIYINGNAATGNIIRGNRIGLNAAGNGAQSNIVGIQILRGSGNIIGGTVSGAGNYISGNSLYGVQIRNGAALSNIVQGNFIGVGDDGTTVVPNGLVGVYVLEGTDSNQIGGTSTNAGNLIKGNPTGVQVDGSGSFLNSIRRNSIYANTTTGITLTNGGNANIAAPVLIRPAPIAGTGLNGGAIDIFVDDADQGEIYVASATVSGGVFTSSFDLSPYEGKNLTATVTSGAGNSSRFSTPILIDVTPPTGLALIGGAVTTDPVVTIGMLVADNFSAESAIQMRFSNDGGLNWTAWEPYFEEKIWDLNQGLVDTSDGFRTATVQFRDASLNESIIYSDTIELDTTGPQVLAFEQLDPTPTQSTEVRYRLAFDEPVLNFETGVSPATDDLALTADNTLTTATISEISDDGGNEYTITVSTGPGDGLIFLDLLTTGGLTDDNGNPFLAAQQSDTYVVDRLAITVQPVGGTPTEGDPFSMSVDTSGGIGEIHYVWYKDGQPILVNNPDDPVLAFMPAIIWNTAEYTVVVSDDYLSIDSDAAYLEVQVRFPALSGLGLAGLTAGLAAAGAWARRRRK